MIPRVLPRGGVGGREKWPFLRHGLRPGGGQQVGNWDLPTSPDQAPRAGACVKGTCPVAQLPSCPVQPGQSSPRVSEFSMSSKEERRAENRAAWAAGESLPRWSTGQNHSAAKPGRTGPPVIESGAEKRKAAKDAKRAKNRAEWAARLESARVYRASVREGLRLARRADDRVRAAAWHQGRRDDAAVLGQ